MHVRGAFQCPLLLTFVHLCDRVFLVMEWVCLWKLFGIPVGDTFQKAYLEEWQLVDDGFTRAPCENSPQTVPCALIVFLLFGTSICDAPWLSLKSVLECVFGIPSLQK